MKKRVGIIVVLIAILFLVILYCAFDPSQAAFFPKCIFHQLTGLQCPGCGSQRAINQLLQLDIAAAMRYNAFMVLCIPLLGFLLFAEVFAERFPRIHKAAHNTYFSWSILVALLFWWILRNIFGW